MTSPTPTMSPSESKLVTVLGVIVAICGAIGAYLTTGAAAGTSTTLHTVALVVGFIGTVAAALGKALGAA